MRNLSYLKYLGFIREIRKKRSKEDHAENSQKFLLVENQEIKDIIYELKANREDIARQKYGKFLSNHELFLGIKNDFFGPERFKTFIDLEHFLKEKNPNKAPAYYQNGGKFIISLLEKARLLQVSGNNIELLNHTNVQKNVESDSALENPEETFVQKKEVISLNIPKLNAEGDAYTISINGPDTNSTWIVKSKKQLAVVKAIITMIESDLKE